MKRLLVVILLFFTITGLAQKKDTSTPVIALYIYNFLTLIDFPEDLVKKEVIIMIPCNDTVSEGVRSNLKAKYEGKLIGDKPLVISDSQNYSDLDKIDLVFVTDECGDMHIRVKEAIGKRPILFVGYRLEYGFSMFNMLLVDGSTKFSLNENYLNRNGLFTNDRLKRLAASVISSEDEWNQLEEKLAELDKKVQSQDRTIISKNEKIGEQQNELYISFAFIGVSLIAGVLIFWSYYQKRKALAELEKQKVLIQHQHEEIMDSIAYAKRIQTAILPPPRLVKEYLANSFVLYKPKDVVAGDFYWMEPVGDKVLFAAADCTGHGVPGAMVSVVCNGGLNRAVREFGLTDPGQILTKTRELVIKEFEKSEEEVKDGMDVALCSLQGRTVEFAGAHNPLWVVRKGADEVEEYKADKQPIGKYAEQKPFNTHKVELNEGDTFYVFSDGFADQFGGEKGKKFKTANFKKLLISIQGKPIDEHKGLIDEAFEHWRGKLEQLDDVCVIGVRV